MTVRPALSTVFAAAHQLVPEAVADRLVRWGASGAVLSAVHEGGFAEVLERTLLASGLPILALEAPFPRTQAARASLAATDRAESKVALDAARATVARAATVGARFVVLRLGEIAVLEREWMFARGRFVRGELGPAGVQALLQSRDEAAEPAFDMARRALEPLCRAAEGAGVTLLVRTPHRYTALPSPRELDLLCAELAGAPLAPTLDLPAAHLLDAMGVYPLALSLAAWASRSPLIFGGDACGQIGALPPGRGVLPLATIAAQLPKDALQAISPWTGLTLDELARFC